MPSSGSESDMAEPTDAPNGPSTALLDGTSELTSVRVDAGDGMDVDEITPGPAPSTYGATDPANPAKPAKPTKPAKPSDSAKKPKKKEKSGQKIVADALKTDMAAERTFFKWLWTGLHTGAIGSFIFVTFDGNKDDPMRIVVVGFSWLVALILVLYGTFAYYRRRHALRVGDISVIPSFTREHSPLIVVVALGLVVGAALLYAGLSPGYSAESAKNAAGAAFKGG